MSDHKSNTPRSLPQSLARMAFRAAAVLLLACLAVFYYPLVADLIESATGITSNPRSAWDVAIRAAFVVLPAAILSPAIYHALRGIWRIDIKAVRGLTLLPAVIVFFLVDEGLRLSCYGESPVANDHIGDFHAVAFVIAAWFRIGMNSTVAKAAGVVDDRPIQLRSHAAMNWWVVFTLLLWLSLSGILFHALGLDTADHALGTAAIALLVPIVVAAVVYRVGVWWFRTTMNDVPGEHATAACPG